MIVENSKHTVAQNIRRDRHSDVQTSDGQGLTLEQFCSTLTLTLQNPYPSKGWRVCQGLQGLTEG